jgi:hypothetical protein
MMIHFLLYAERSGGSFAAVGCEIWWLVCCCALCDLVAHLLHYCPQAEAHILV